MAVVLSLSLPIHPILSVRSPEWTVSRSISLALWSSRGGRLGPAEGVGSQQKGRGPDSMVLCSSTDLGQTVEEER